MTTPAHDAVVACATEDCEQLGVQVTVKLHENADGVFRTICGICGGNNNILEMT
jgi:hypothetical protein